LYFEVRKEEEGKKGELGEGGEKKDKELEEADDKLSKTGVRSMNS
jgi:hypothetical protein